MDQIKNINWKINTFVWLVLCIWMTYEFLKQLPPFLKMSKLKLKQVLIEQRKHPMQKLTRMPDANYLMSLWCQNCSKYSPGKYLGLKKVNLDMVIWNFCWQNHIFLFLWAKPEATLLNFRSRGVIYFWLCMLETQVHDLCLEGKAMAFVPTWWLIHLYLAEETRSNLPITVIG